MTTIKRVAVGVALVLGLAALATIAAPTDVPDSIPDVVADQVAMPAADAASSSCRINSPTFIASWGCGRLIYWSSHQPAVWVQDRKTDGHAVHVFASGNNGLTWSRITSNGSLYEPKFRATYWQAPVSHVRFCRGSNPYQNSWACKTFYYPTWVS